MKEIARTAIESVYCELEDQKVNNSFEVFGLDYMIDEDLKLYLIEINTNPDITVCCGLLQKLIPVMIDNALRIAVDPVFPPTF